MAKRQGTRTDDQELTVEERLARVEGALAECRELVDELLECGRADSERLKAIGIIARRPSVDGGE